ncbi:hypothetical protein [Halorhabdus amylolytica]|uniref:hypothetical protein n=1 Tax=Halorhabdus amylolytica TaxID=2559573 RepID=UPI0010AB3CA0|nr:hypothetical protein [Halorhabdus amylolytica]
MNRRTFLALCGTGVLGLTGCQTTANDETPQLSEDSPTGDRTPTETDTVPATETTTPTKATDGTDSPAGTGTETTPVAVSVEYDVRAGDVPDALQSLEVTLQVVFVADTDEMTACLRETYTGPYKPTVTPISTPTADACRRSEPVTVDLAEEDQEFAIGPVNASVTDAAGHALIVTDVTATSQDGESVPIKGADGHRVRIVERRVDGSSRFEIGLAAGPDEAEYDYELVSTMIDSTA